MRQRKVANKDEILDSCLRWTVKDPTGLKGDWKKIFQDDGPIYLEIGSGKGQFITRLAQREPSCNFIAAEGGANIVVRTFEKAQSMSLSNLMIIPEYITDPGLMFGPGEIAGLYINFCDPWPKERHAKRRLTHSGMLEKYRCISKPNATLAFKTDNSDLFEFSLEEFKKAGLAFISKSKDLHNSSYAANNITTEYEDKFAATGKPIFYAVLSFPGKG